MTKKEGNPVRVAALICVAVTSAFLMWMNNKVINILASPDWCSKALQAERVSAQEGGGLTSCNSLLTIQVKSLATVNHIQSGTIALCLLVLIVIVIAGGRLNLSAGKTGINANMGRDNVDPVAAADAVAGAANEKADEIAATVTPPGRPKDDGSDAATFTPSPPMPEPPGSKP